MDTTISAAGSGLTDETKYSVLTFILWSTFKKGRVRNSKRWPRKGQELVYGAQVQLLLLDAK